MGIQRGIVAQTADEAVEARKKSHRNDRNRMACDQSTNPCRWTWKKGRVKLAKNLDEVKSIADQIIGMQLVTTNTSHRKTRAQVLVAEDVYYPGESEPSEFYVSVLLNRSTGRKHDHVLD